MDVIEDNVVFRFRLKKTNDLITVNKQKRNEEQKEDNPGMNSPRSIFCEIQKVLEVLRRVVLMMMSKRTRNNL